MSSPVRATSTNRPVELLAVKVEVQITGLDCGDRVVAVCKLPRSPVPDDDVARAVLGVRDHAFEVEVLERVVFDVHGHPLHVGIERRSFWNRPTDENPIELESQVVVKPARSMALHHEPMSIGHRRRRAGRLGRDREVALLPVGLETGVGALRPCLGRGHGRGSSTRSSWSSGSPYGRRRPSDALSPWPP